MLLGRVVHPDFPGLSLQGLVQPLGAIMPLAEIQVDWIARLIAGTCKFPDRAVMAASIQKEADRNRRRYKQSARHTLQVDYYPYNQSI